MSRPQLERDTTPRRPRALAGAAALAFIAALYLDGTAPIWIPTLLASGAWVVVIWAIAGDG